MDVGTQFPNCWIVHASIKTQHDENFDPVEKLLVRVTASDGTTCVYRCGFDSWTAMSLLTQFRPMARKQLAVQLALKSKGRATFVDVSCCEDAAFQRVQLPESAFTGEKLGYDDTVDCISGLAAPPRTTRIHPLSKLRSTSSKMSSPLWWALRRSLRSLWLVSGAVACDLIPVPLDGGAAATSHSRLEHLYQALCR